MRGVNLNASPVVHDDPQVMIQLIEEFAQDSGRSGSYTRVWNRYGSGENASTLRNQVLEYGENSRWIVVAHRRIGEDAHAFNIEVRDGEVRLVDAQAHSAPVEPNLDGRQVIERDGQLIEHSRYRFFDLYRVDPADPNPDYSSYRFFRGRPADPTDPGSTTDD